MGTITIQGTYATAIVYTTGTGEAALKPYAAAQIQRLCDDEAARGSRIRVMPDVHPGKVCVIGLTMTVGDRVLPEVVGSDIGCGVTMAKVTKVRREFAKLDARVHEKIPAGSAVRQRLAPQAEQFPWDKLQCRRHLQYDRAMAGLGTLGSGNHFLELGVAADGAYYVTVHTGSRYVGQAVTTYYLLQGQRELRRRGIDVPYEWTWLEGGLKDAYCHDVQLVQAYASLNRQIIIHDVCKAMKWKIVESHECRHNYLDFSQAAPLLRKGAISAKNGEWVAIPISMQAGILVGTGLGNREWNQSAPHGAGRILMRSEVANSCTVAAMKRAMKGVYTSCLTRETLDEAPVAYRPLADIRAAIPETVCVTQLVKPVYNFKGGRP